MHSLRTTFGRWFINGFVPVFFPRLNPLALRVLRSRYHWLLSWYVAAVRFPGRRSGRVYEVPFTLYRVGETTVLCLTGRKGSWWRNLLGGVDAEVLLRGRWLPARAEAIEDLDVIRGALDQRDLSRRLLLALAPEDGVVVRVTLNNDPANV